MAGLNPTKQKGQSKVTICANTHREVEMIDHGNGTLGCPACGEIMNEETLEVVGIVNPPAGIDADLRWLLNGLVMRCGGSTGQGAPGYISEAITTIKGLFGKGGA